MNTHPVRSNTVATTVTHMYHLADRYFVPGRLSRNPFWVPAAAVDIKSIKRRTGCSLEYHKIAFR